MPRHLDPNKNITIHVDGDDYVIKDIRESHETRINIEKITNTLIRGTNKVNIHEYGVANGLTWEQSHCFLRHVINQIKGIA